MLTTNSHEQNVQVQDHDEQKKEELHYTFYTQPWLFYPRRIHSYLTFKPLPSHITTSLIPVSFTTKGEMTKHPGKPDTATIPLLRFGRGENDIIRQSVAILSYLEEAHPRSASGAENDMRGGNAMERARVGEIVSLVEEASQAFGFWVMHSSSLYSPKVRQSRDASKTAEDRLHKTLNIIEDYCQENVVERGLWSAGTEGVTLADICLASLVEYARDFYGRDLCASGEHEVLKVWVGKWEGTEAGKRGGGKTPPEEFARLARENVWE